MKVLRDLRLSTKMLIMFELVNDTKIKLKPLAEKLEMTVQGVSEYLKRMEQEGLIQRFPGEHRPTKNGVQFLQENIVGLRDFVVEAIKRVEIIRMCAAVAGNRIKAGDRVGLFMENGMLVAYARRASASTGIAAADTEPGGDVPVRDLDGIVELSQGMLSILELPSIENMGTRSIPFEKAKKTINKIKPDRLGALDTVGLVLMRKLGFRCDFEFAAPQAGIEATQKGLDVLLLGGADEVHRIVSAIEEMNAKSTDKLRYELIRIK